MDDREAGQQKLDNLEVSDEHLLLAKGLWSFVDGTEVLADGADAAARTDFQQKTQKAFSTIVMAVSVPQLISLRPLRVRVMRGQHSKINSREEL